MYSHERPILADCVEKPRTNQALKYPVFYNYHTGRPAVDPELMIRMLVLGYSFGIRSERRQCEEVHLNLACRWFCRSGLEDAALDHSTFS